MVAGLRSYLFAAGVEVPLEVERGHECFDPDNMLNRLNTDVSEALHDGYAGVWGTGDMTWEFGPRKDSRSFWIRMAS